MNISSIRIHPSTYGRLIRILIANGFLGIGLLLIAREYDNVENIWNYLSAILIILVDLCFYLNSNNNQKAELLIVVTWEWTIIIEFIYRVVRFDKTPFRILYIPDILCLFFFIDMLCRGKLKIKYRNNILLVFFVVLGSLISLFNMRNILDYLHGLMLIIRPWSLYLYSSTTQVKLPKWSKCIFGISIGAFILETLANYNVDFRNGIFGYEYVGGLFQLVLVVWLSNAIATDLRKNKERFLWIKIGIVELIFALREAKMECVLLIVWILVLTVVSRKKQKEKVVLYPILLILIGIIGWNLIPVFSPKWAYVFDNWSFTEIVYGVLSRIFGDSQTMSFGDFLKKENFSLLNYLFGIGFGAAQPPAYYRFMFLPISGLSGFPNSIWISSLITKHYYNWVESLIFYNGIYDVVIDLGIVGVMVFVFIVINYLYKSYRLCQSASEKSNILGSIGIWATLYLFYRMIQYNILVVPLAMMVFGMVFGMIEYQYRQEHKTNNILKRIGIEGERK